MSASLNNSVVEKTRAHMAPHWPDWVQGDRLGLAVDLREGQEAVQFFFNDVSSTCRIGVPQWSRDGLKGQPLHLLLLFGGVATMSLRMFGHQLPGNWSIIT
eukprot:TRINITY_DN1219_c0_g1_i3.p3 TRINITY_DN1219_c0_g1~~TRINITY_DN1219_c0_g1_i3.p3  ORF type:complete len:101 (-),score=16.44 TRINITY_DN1219_c0_g1_i3:13-315(-)